MTVGRGNKGAEDVLGAAPTGRPRFRTLYSQVQGTPCRRHCSHGSRGLMVDGPASPVAGIAAEHFTLRARHTSHDCTFKDGELDMLQVLRY